MQNNFKTIEAECNETREIAENGEFCNEKALRNNQLRSAVYVGIKLPG